MKLTRWGQMDESLSLRFTLPVIGEHALTIAVGLLFSQVISGISASALAAIGMANSVMTVAFAIFSMVTTGASVLVARQLGAREAAEAADTVEQTILLSLISSILITAICYTAAGPILRLLMSTTEDQLFQESVRYFRILVLSLPMYVLHTALSTISRAMGDSKNPLIVTVTMNIIQVIAGYVLIVHPVFHVGCDDLMPLLGEQCCGCGAVYATTQCYQDASHISCRCIGFLGSARRCG